ncbi:hypothetical protein [Achromobacter insuavis]|uniref:hypothetical protein n=1 Tax=Achromobacter insuavis TaxID=1287735 RepID=UPI001F13C8C2|nr:hypothetical protein [Achromobacter insuavis]
MLDFEEKNSDIDFMRDVSLNELSGLKPSPTFKAVYTFPEEFRALTLRKRGKATLRHGGAMLPPFVIFIAKPSVKAGF